jgi:hypothetical protein
LAQVSLAAQLPAVAHDLTRIDGSLPLEVWRSNQIFPFLTLRCSAQQTSSRSDPKPAHSPPPLAAAVDRRVPPVILEFTHRRQTRVQVRPHPRRVHPSHLALMPRQLPAEPIRTPLPLPKYLFPSPSHVCKHQCRPLLQTLELGRRGQSFTPPKSFREERDTISERRGSS